MYFAHPKVPEVLLNGNHKEINEFRLNKSIERTKIRRPDLYEKYKKEMILFSPYFITIFKIFGDDSISTVIYYYFMVC